MHFGCQPLYGTHTAFELFARLLSCRVDAGVRRAKSNASPPSLASEASDAWEESAASLASARSARSAPGEASAAASRSEPASDDPELTSVLLTSSGKGMTISLCYVSNERPPLRRRPLVERGVAVILQLEPTSARNAHLAPFAV